MFLLAIYTKCKYWQWSLDFEISCSSFWNLEAITSTNWIRKQRTPSTWSPVYDVALNLRKWTQNIRDSKCMEEPWLKLLWQDFIIRLRETLQIFVTISMTVLNANVFPDDLTAYSIFLLLKKRHLMSIIFLTWSIQLIFSILLQHHISKLSRYFWSAARSIMWEMKKCYFVSMSRGISYMKYENGRLTGLVTSYVETAF